MLISMPKLLDYWVAILIIILLLGHYFKITDSKSSSSSSSPQVPCFFIFGDSMVDSGNNNKISTEAKANYLPYGLDFPGVDPTGRFSNGQTVADVIGKLIGFENFIKSFPNVKRSDMLKGVNYASGFSGIRHETGRHMGGRFPLSKQLEHHQIIISRLNKVLGNNQSAVDNHLSRCLYLMATGNNDYINNYFLPRYYNTSRHFSTKHYAKLLVQQYSHQLKTLHHFGARKVAVAGASAVGCTPFAVSISHGKNSSCVHHINKAVDLFNSRLKALVKKLNKDLPGARFMFLGVYTLTLEFASSRGYLLTGCCPVTEQGLCIPGKPPCENRHLALFWDSFHPTENFNTAAGTLSYLHLKKILD